MKIVEGILQTPVKIVLYGTEGIGKSTLASCFPDPLFIDTEGSTDRMNIRRIMCRENWSELLSNIDEVKRTPDICKTLVIDTADWAEQMCLAYCCQRDKQKNITSYPFGNGYGTVATEFKNLLNALNDVVASGKNVVVTAHAAPRKYELPEEQGQYDKWEMKLTKKSMPLLKEWCDALLFCNYETFVTTSKDGKGKATGGKKRMIYTTHSATYDAKNRFDLPDELPMCWDSIKGIVPDMPETKTAPAPEKTRPAIAGLDSVPAKTEKGEQRKKLDSFMEADGITAEELMAVAISRGKAHEGDTIDDLPENRIAKWVIPNWTSILNVINHNKEN